MPEDDLEPLITECPGCRTRFRVSEDQLQRARGRVRCGACLTVFNGVEHLDGVNPQTLDQGAAGRTLDALLDELSADAGTDVAAPDPEAVPTDAAASQPAASKAAPPPTVAPPPETPAAPVTVASVAAPAAGQAQRRAQSVGPLPAAVAFGEPRRRRPWLWVALPLGLVLLAAQVLWLRFDDWSTDPFWRGVYGPACGVLGCELPVRRDIGQLGTRQLAVRSHPQQPGSLLVSAVIVNEAEFAQPFPMLELRFTTPRGLLVAGRRFAPAEYLSGDARGMTRFPPRTPVQIELTIDDPGPDAVNYFLRFR